MTCAPSWPRPRLVCSVDRAFCDGAVCATASHSVWSALNPDHGDPALVSGCPDGGVPARLLDAIKAAVTDNGAPLRGLLYVHSGMAPQDRNPMLVFLLHALETAGFAGLETLSLRVPAGAPLPPEAHRIATVLPSGGGLCLLVHDRIHRLGRPGEIRDAGFALWAVNAPAAGPSAQPLNDPERNEDV